MNPDYLPTANGTEPIGRTPADIAAEIAVLLDEYLSRADVVRAGTGLTKFTVSSETPDGHRLDIEYKGEMQYAACIQVELTRAK